MSSNSDNPTKAGQISRRTFLKLGSMAAGSMTLASLLAACAPAAAPAAPVTEAAPAPAAGAPRVGGELVIGSIQEPDSLNPWLTGLTVGLEVESMIYDSLTRVDPTGEHVPLLAAEVPSLENGDISEDLLTYTYKLRDDVTWHDGTPFTAADVVFTYEAIANPEVNARARIGFELVDSVEAVDDHTVVFHLKEPSAVFLETWGYRGILPKHIFENEDMNTSEFNRAPSVGTGPYKFVEWVSGDRIVVERNENYYREGGYIDRIDYRIVPSSDTLLTMLETGEIDMRFSILAEQVTFARGLEDFEIYATPAHAYFHFTINNADPILGDKLVRQALTHGLNKQLITDTVLQGLVMPHGSPVAQPSWVYVDHNDRFPLDPEQAKALLEQAGWAEGSDGIRTKDGERLALTLLNIAGDTERLQIVQLAQAMWKEIGVEVNISQVDAATFVAAMVEQNYQFAYGFWGFSVDPSGYNERWLSTSAGHWLNYDNPEVDKLLLDALKVIDRDERKALYTQFQDIVVEDATNIWVYNRVFFDAVKKRVKGFVPSASSSTNMWNVYDWWLEE
ncbi:MAG: peptide ABC transporter substrate-binding protein [Caldilineaceae bacterium]|nr:peptide ABC transporter substrate-binding protein [Caldilineaceae bacterium]